MEHHDRSWNHGISAAVGGCNLPFLGGCLQVWTGEKRHTPTLRKEGYDMPPRTLASLPPIMTLHKPV